MIIDSHIHTDIGKVDRQLVAERMRKANIGGGAVFSIVPKAHSLPSHGLSSDDRMKNVLEWCEGNDTLYPFYFLDPLEQDACEQVDEAVKQGIDGFKIILRSCFAYDEPVIKVCERIARHSKPVLFHSGILYLHGPTSRFNRPADFEALMLIEGLRIAMAHISWPWTDEMVAVYGKVDDTRQRYPGSPLAELFVDLTPGTPECYRYDAIYKLLSSNMDVKKNIIYGIDTVVNDYDVDMARGYIDMDNKIFDRLGLDFETREDIFQNNFYRFLGKSAADREV